MCLCRVDVVKHKMDHLSCFIPAMLALGAHAGAVKEEKAKRYMQVRYRQVTEVSMYRWSLKTQKQI